jgi:hypothetical protein
VLYHKYFADDLGESMGQVCVLHSLTTNGDTAILDELLSAIGQSGLLDRLDRLYVVNVGDEIGFPAVLAGHSRKVRVINRTPPSPGCSRDRRYARSTSTVRA